MMGMPCNWISGLGSLTPSCARREPSPAAMIANFILLVLIVVGLLQVQAVAVVALLEVELAQRILVGLGIVLSVAVDINSHVEGLAERVGRCHVLAGRFTHAVALCFIKWLFLFILFYLHLLLVE